MILFGMSFFKGIAIVLSIFICAPGAVFSIVVGYYAVGCFLETIKAPDLSDSKKASEIHKLIGPLIQLIVVISIMAITVVLILNIVNNY